MESINELLIKEHGKLLSFLINFTKEEDKEKAKNLFDNFKWTLQKHFFVEEKAIFNFYEKIKGEEVHEIFDLMGEHGDLLELMKFVEEDFSKDKIEDLKKLLIKHQNFEDDVFYPKLDKDLNEQQKKELIEKIKEVVRV
ncbi:MAG: hemerythrin domain-containing protein [Nanoarchaeota archaeon]